MAKTLFLYTDGNDPAGSAALRTAAGGLPFTELRLDRDLRRHNVTFFGVQAVIDVDGVLIFEAKAADLQTVWAAAPVNAPAPPADAVNPLITRMQARATIKTLLETNPNAWTQLQRDQCAYLLLLGLFKDLKTGTVY